jgi:hypothetical protein
MDAVRPKTYTSQAKAETLGVFKATARTHRACNNAHEERLTYLNRFKCKKLMSNEERVAKLLVYSRFFDTQFGERSANGVDGLLAALKRTSESKRVCTPQPRHEHQDSSDTNMEKEAATPTLA